MKLELKEQERAAKKFVADWLDKGNEKSDTQNFWIRLLHDVYGVDDPTSYIQFEKRVKNQYTRNVNFIDGYISNTLVLIEQKDIKIDLSKPELRSGKMVTPYEQAKGYADSLRNSEKPNWIITSNFKEFWIYDMDQIEPDKNGICIPLEDLPKRAHEMNFLISEKDHHLSKEMALSIQAGDLVGELYDAFSKQYHAVSTLDEKTIDNHLNRLCVRIVFCLYAEDSGLFGTKTAFHDYLEQFETKHMRKALVDLFKVLNTKVEERDPFMDEDLAAFPYVNGGLFADDDLMIPHFTDELKNLLLSHASDGFDWSDISPTIFGAVFESTLNPETRRSGGMHYTSIENIHKVIDPLFLDDLKQEFREIKELKQPKTIEKRINEFQEKLANLTFLDPACGSGNFLTETYLSIRRLENQVIAYKNKNQGQWLLDNVDSPIKVSINQFYGIEINDFAVTVAKTALWIAECQMMKETEDIILSDLDFLPLTTNASIIEENALRIDWNKVISSDKVDYIMGNPPFVGFTYMSKNQKDDMAKLFPGIKNLDFVCGWYKKCSDYIQNTKIECGLVSTNSIVQGETCARLWECLNVKINFAYRTFEWDSEAKTKAHVHCVILGFAYFDRNKKILYSNDSVSVVKNINYYLYDAPNILVKSRNKPLCNVNKMIYGNKPADGGNLIVEKEDLNLFKQDECARKYIRPLLGASEFLHNKERYCLWLDGVSPAELKKSKLILERIKKCKESRLSSVAKGIQKFADTPSLFAQRTQPVGKEFILIPRVSSQRRNYIPIGFIDGDTIVTDAVQIIPEASLFEFGIITSSVHMSWMKVVCGRLKSDFRYSKDVVYNNFPWVEVSYDLKNEIIETSKKILEARSKYLDSSLADLYDPLLMPVDLRKAHEENDKAVMKAYGFKTSMSEEEIVAELMKMYQELTK